MAKKSSTKKSSSAEAMADKSTTTKAVADKKGLIKFAAINGRNINSVSNGGFRMRFKGRSPWKCSAEKFAELQKAVAGQFIEAK